MCVQVDMAKYYIRNRNAAVYRSFFLLSIPLVILREAAISLPSRIMIRVGKTTQRLGNQSAFHSSGIGGHAHELVQK
jgi:hypothetical protein